VEDVSTHSTRGALRVQEPATLEKSQRNKRPPGYLADYHVGHMELLSLGDSTPSTGNYPSEFVGNFLQ